MINFAYLSQTSIIVSLIDLPLKRFRITSNRLSSWFWGVPDGILVFCFRVLVCRKPIKRFVNSLGFNFFTYHEKSQREFIFFLNSLTYNTSRKKLSTKNQNKNPPFLEYFYIYIILQGKYCQHLKVITNEFPRVVLE